MTKSSEARELAKAASEITRAVADLTNLTKAASIDGDALPAGLAELRVVSSQTVMRLLDITKPTWIAWRERFGIKPVFTVLGHYYWSESDIVSLRKRLAAEPIRVGRPPRTKHALLAAARAERAVKARARRARL